MSVAKNIAWGRLAALALVIAGLWVMDLNVALWVSTIFALIIAVDAWRDRAQTRIAWRNCRASFRWRQLIYVPLAVSVPTLAIITVLYSLGGAMEWSWFAMLPGSDGQASNAGISGTTMFPAPLGAAFLLVLVWFMPNLVHWEEAMFREGRTKVREWIPASIAFGFVHMLVGVPLAAAIGLIWPGIIFALVYKRSGEVIDLPDGRKERFHNEWDPTVWHLLHNLTMLALIAAVIIAS